MTTTVYKTTDKHARTHGCHWEPGVWKEERPGGPVLKGPHWYYCYRSPYVAELIKICGDFHTYLLWEAEAEGASLHDGLTMRSGYTRMRIVKPIPRPLFSVTQRTRFAIRLAKDATTDEEWTRWADRWLCGEDRTEASALIALALATAAGETAHMKHWDNHTLRLQLIRATTFARYAAEAAVWAARDSGNPDTANKVMHIAARTIFALGTTLKVLDLHRIAEQALLQA